jgi:hypothetical protein
VPVQKDPVLERKDPVLEQKGPVLGSQHLSEHHFPEQIFQPKRT